MGERPVGTTNVAVAIATAIQLAVGVAVLAALVLFVLAVTGTMPDLNERTCNAHHVSSAKPETSADPRRSCS